MPTAPVSSDRLISVDLYRGIAVAGMLLVDYQGSEADAYWPLRHAEWNGWTAADLVFPSFLFLVGLSVALATRARLQRGESKRKIVLHAARRTAILIVMGIALNGFPEYDFATLRLEGVIQRIAICYFVTTVLYLWTGWRAQAAAILMCLVGYWALLRLVPVPGFGMPGRDIAFLDPDSNLTAWIDRAVFAGRLYNGTRDPEGLLSTIPAIGSSLIGLLAGQWMQSAYRTGTKLGVLIISGLAGLVLGAGWSAWFPINKNLWTSSFVVFTAGWALLIFALCYWIVELKGWRGRWTVPFLVFGMNALLGFVLDMALYAPMHYGRIHGVSWKEYVYQHLSGRFDPANASLIYAMGIVVLAWLMLWFLYRRRLFVRV